MNVFPEVGSMPIDQIKPIHCLNIIDTITNRGSHTVAVLVRQWMSQIFRFAAARLLVESDPTFLLKGAIFKDPVRHNPPLKKTDIPFFFSKLKTHGGRRTTVIAVHLLAHTFVRTGELRKAEWKEFDLSEKLWVIPAENTKKRRKHLVPLTDIVIDYLQELKILTGNSLLLFPNTRDRNRPMGSSTINRVIERCGFAGQFSGHGFRSTASTYLNEEGWNSDVIERQLAHVEQKSERKAYNHAEYLPERIKMMCAWSEFLSSSQAAD